jgi:lysophospholipase L1-like esterase
LASLTTTNKTNLVAAVNEVKGQANTNATAITAETTRATGVEGSLASLTTTDKTTLVAAVNEVDAHADTNATAITAETARLTGVEGSLASLTTTVKTSLVAAINEVDSHADTNTAAIATETTNRTAADTALGVRIDLSVVGAADSYDRTDSSTSLGSMPNGQVWTTSPGGNVWGLDDGMAYSPVPYAASWAVTQTARWNVDIQAPIILGTQATSEVGLAFRFVDNPNHMHACLTLVDSTGVSVVRIVRHIGNVGKVLASVDFPLTHGETYLMRVVVVDREVQVIVDDQFVVGVSLTNDEFEVLGVNGTKHGMYMGLSDTTSRIARITIQTIPTVDRFLGGEVVQDMVYSSSIDPSIEDLHATVAYPIGRRYLPVLVAIHDFTFSETYFTADILKRLAGYGMVVMAVGLRGRNGAGGLADADGREIYDIKDALDALRVQFPRAAHRVYQSLVDYGSGAGFAAAVKLPDYFAEIISYWSPSDIGGDPTYGWYQEYVAGRTAIANMVGGTPTTMPTAYASRQHRLAAGNYTGGYLRTYHDLANTVVPPDQSSRFTAAMTTAGLSNFATPHTSNTGDTVRYLQQRPDAGTGAQISEADWNNSIAAMSHAPWAIPDTGTVRVEGFLAAKAIELWLAAGQGTADEATLVYNITGRIFTVTLLGSNYIDAYKILVHGLDPNTPVNATINGTVYTETTDEGGTATFYWNVYDWMVGPFRFDQAESSPIVFPHLEAGAWGKLQGSDSGSKYSIASSKLTATTHTTAFANPYVYIMDLDDSSFERVTGYCLHFVNTGLVKAGFANESDAFTIIRSGFQLFANNDWRVLQNAATIGPMNALSSSTEYEYWIIVADFGANIYVKGGAFTEPTLLWNENFNDNGNLNRVSPGRFVINHSGGLNMQSVEAIYLGGAFSRFASLANYFHVRPVLPQSGTGLVDGFIAANYDFTTSDVVNIYFHYTDAANCWVLRLTQGSNAMDLIEYNPALGGGFAIRATTNPTLSTTGGTSRVAVRWRGARIDAICSGTNTARLNYTTAAFNLTEGGWRLPAENSPATRVRVLPLYVPGSAMPRKTGKHATNFWFIGDSKTVGSTDTDQAGGLSGYNYMFRHLWAIGQGAGANARPNQTAQGGIQVSNIIDDTFATNIPDSLDAATDTPQKVLINLTVNDSNLTDADKTTWKTQFQTGIIDAIKNKWPEEHIEFYLARMWHRGNPTGDDRINSWVEELILENPGVCFPGIDERTFLPYTFDIATSTWVYDPAGTYTGTGGGVEIATVDGTHPGHRGYKRTAEEWYKAVTGDTLVYDGV